MADDDLLSQYTADFRRIGSRQRRDREGENQLNEILGPDPNRELIAEMRKNRRVSALHAKQGVVPNVAGGGAGGRGGANISFATGRPRDPMFYWRENNIPYDINKPDHLKMIRQWCRHLYLSHPILGSVIDVFSKYPLTGLELTCKDEALVDFYSELFLEQLNYEEFLIDVGRERWTVGEAWPLGSFNETLGVWEDDELINPDNVEVERSPFLKEPRFKMRLPDTIRDVLEKRNPKWEYEALVRSYPELVNFMGEDALMPVSNVLLKQIKFKGDTFHVRGIPILMRAFRAVIQEEMLNAAQDAVADRLYTPLILAKIGASASDLGTNTPWIPTEGDLEDFTEALDAAFAADFRVLVHHFAVSMENVIGREMVPNFVEDFERLESRQLQVFGMSKTMLEGAGQGETYAADAINRDLISQLLTTHQKVCKKLFKDRMLVVAEAQQHYDYEERGGKKYPVFEEVLEVDEETGEPRIVEQPKLLVPDVHIKAMNMADEKDLRQFYEALRQQGVPISMKTRLVNVPIDLKDEQERVHEEMVEQAVEGQQIRKDQYEALKAQNLPIPDDLKKDFDPTVAQAQDDGVSHQQPVPLAGTLTPDAELPLVAPPMMGQGQEDGQPLPHNEDAPQHNVVPLPRNRQRPPESDEQRENMPKPASLMPVTSETDDGPETREIEPVLINGPKHIGMRVKLEKDMPLDEQLEKYRDKESG